MSDTTRAQEITAALTQAYQNASKLKISKAEAKKLMKAFPENQIEVLQDGAIYLPHIFLSQRLNEVFGPGSWMMTCRKHDHDGHTITTEHVLVIRGCAVGEAFGQADFDGRSKKSTYGDVMETLAAQALRRICGKRLSCGSQLWQPDFVQKWLAKHAEQYSGKIDNGREMVSAMLWKKKGAKVVMNAATETPSVVPTKFVATDDDRFVMLQLVGAVGKELALNYAISNQILKPGQTLEEWPLEFVVVTQPDILRLQQDIEAFGRAKNPPPQTGWKNFRMPFGRKVGCKMEDLDLDMLLAYWQERDDKELKKVYPQFIEAIEEMGREKNFQSLKKTKKK